MKYFLKVLLFFLILAPNISYATCTYTGGYPWQPNGCLTAADLNSAFALAYEAPSILASGAVVANLGYQPMDPGQNLNDLNNKNTAMNNLIGYIPLSVTSNLNDLSDKGQALLNLKAAAQVPDNATLILTAISVFPQGVQRNYVVTPGDAPAVSFYGQVGTCASRSMVSNVGYCNDAVGGNSWVAVYPTGKLDVRQFGAKLDGTTDNTIPFQAVITQSSSTGACVYIPYNLLGYVTSAALTWPTSSKDQCLTGDPMNTAQNYPITQKPLIKTTDTDCVVTNGVRLSIYNISCLGNGSTSTSPNTTVCVHYSLGGYDAKLFNVTCSGYVEGFRLTGRTRAELLTVDNSGLRPNLINDFPSYCVHNIDPSFNVEVVHVSGLFCRDQGTVLVTEFTGDGSTTYFDFHVANGSGITNQANVIWSSDSIQACQAMTTAGRYPCIPLVPGTDLTLYDCGASPCAGSGGTLLPVYVLKTATISGNPQVTVANTAALSAGKQFKVWAEHNLKEPTYVVSVDDSTHVTLSNAPTSTNSAVKYTFYKVNLSAGSCGIGTSPTCGYNLEVRFTTAPPAGINVEIQHNDPWSYVGIYDEDGTEGQYDVEMMGGIRNIISTGGVGTYGETHVNVDYWEIGNYCMTVDEGANSGYFNAATSTEVNVRRNVRPTTILGTNMRCPIWIPPTGYGNRLIFNGSDWRKFEGTTALGGISNTWTIGSDTAPISSTAGKLEISLANITCPGGVSNLNLQGSEDGLTFLGGTSYTYAMGNQTPADPTYVSARSTGTNAIILSANSLNTSGAYNADIIVGSPGLIAPHPVQVNVAMVDSGGAGRSIMGSGTIVGTPAKLKALRVNCGAGGTTILGQIWYREIW